MNKNLNRLLTLLFLGVFAFNVSGSGFTDDHDDGTLDGWTIEGNRPWSESGESAKPANNNSNTGFLINNHQCTDDGVFEVNYSTDQWNGNRGGVVFRWTSPSSYYYVAVLPGNQYSSHLIFQKNSMDIETASVVASNFPIGTTFTLKIELEGDTFRFYTDDVLRGEVTDNSHSSGQVGYAYSNEWNSYTEYDNSSWTDVNSGYLLTVDTDGNGTVSPSSGQFPEGQEVTVTATPEADWSFSHWSGSHTGTDNPLTFTIDSDVSLTANFEQIPQYSLQVTSTGEGTVMPESGTFYEGDTVVITASASTGWHFDSWGGSIVDSINPVTIIMDSDKDITASFSKNIYSLSVVTDGQGNTTPSSGSFEYGDTVTLEATADQGWRFTGWSGDLNETSNPTSVIMNSDKNITAHFEQILHSLSVSADGEGTVSPDSGSYPLGDTVSISATAQQGWFFTGWSGDVTGSDNPTSIVMNSDKSITAHFAQTTFSLDVTTEGMGRVSPDSGTFGEGDTVYLTAAGDPGWQFTGWSGDLVSSENPAAVIMNSEKNIIAHFEQILHSLSVSAGTGGSVTPSSGQFPQGDTVIITASAEEGYLFTDWRGDLTGTHNPAEVRMDSDKDIIADFEMIQYSLSVDTEGNGSVTPDSGTYTYHDSVTITATAQPGWRFVEWTGDHTGTQNPAIIFMDADKSITARFEQITYSFSATVEGQGSISPASGTYAHGDTVTVAAVPEQGWRFSEWTGDKTGSENPLSFVITSDISLIAHFDQIPQYSLAITSEGEGTVTPDTGTYSEGDTVSVTARGSTGWTFDHWSGDFSGTQNPAHVVMDSSKSIIAHFVQIPTYQLSVDVQGNGSVVPDQGSFPQGDTVIITATGEPGWIFDHWSGSITGSQNPLTVVMDTNIALTATFIEYIPSVPNSSKLSISAKIHDMNGNPIGSSQADTIDMVIKLFSHETAGVLKYTESFLSSANQGIVVENGNFVARLGEGTTNDNLAQILSENIHLWVEISLGGEALKRIPLTGAAYDLSSIP